MNIRSGKKCFEGKGIQSKKDSTLRSKVYGVSLGPGDPELVTIKAIKVLARADKIYYPATLTRSGEVNSFALEILKMHSISETRLKSMPVAMTMPRKEVDKVYDKAFSSIMQDLENSLCIAVVCIGDAGLYSTFGHLLERLKKASVTVEMIAGVPAFVAAGASAHVLLALGSDKVLVLPDFESTDELDKCLDRYETVVVMKLSLFGEKLYSYLEKKRIGFVYAEYLGTPREFVSRSLNDLESRRIPYFSLIILFNKDQSSRNLCPEK